MAMSRRALIVSTPALALARSARAQAADRSIALVLAPSNLGLRPAESGAEQGAWRAPAALRAAGLADAIGASAVIELARPGYEMAAQPGTRIRNGQSIRAFSLELAAHIETALARAQFPVVIGGDCSILLGCLLAARRRGGRGLIHIDGHSDFFHPGNYDAGGRLGSAAGMDLALATGRGEEVLTQWPDIDGPLVRDTDAIQIGERDALSPDYDLYYGDVVRTDIARFIIQDVLEVGIAETTRRVLALCEERELDRAWLHVDFDVLDQNVMPAVDSPGSPGLTFDQLAELVAGLCRSGRVLGADFAIYDPERDPDLQYARPLVACIARGLRAVSPNP
jgi:arginase